MGTSTLNHITQRWFAGLSPLSTCCSCIGDISPPLHCLQRSCSRTIGFFARGWAHVASFHKKHLHAWIGHSAAIHANWWCSHHELASACGVISDVMWKHTSHFLTSLFPCGHSWWSKFVTASCSGTCRQLQPSP